MKPFSPWARPARISAWLLLMVWVGPVTIVQTDTFRVLKMLGAPEPAMAEPRVIPAGRAIYLQVGTPMEIRLRDGSVRWGRFLGRALLDSAAYEERFAAHGRSSSYEPLVLGETLHVVLRDGREMTAPFAGYGELTLLLRGPESQLVRLPFESTREIRRASGDRVEPRHLARAFRGDSLPSAEALALGDRLPATNEPEWAGALLVPVDDIASTLVELPSAGGAKVAVVVILAVVALLVIAAQTSSGPTASGCTSTGKVPGGFAGVLTQHPFDRDRGCFVGDPLAVADAWPSHEGGAGAPAELPSSDALASASPSR